MQNSVVGYTGTASIRACLGIDESDCPDRIIVDSGMDLELISDLDSWLPTHSTVDSEGKAALATSDQKANRSHLLLYSRWFCAKEIAARPLLFPKSTSDGKAKIERFSNYDPDKIVSFASSRAAKYKNLLSAAILGGSGSSEVISPLGVSSPDIDAVTGQ